MRSHHLNCLAVQETRSEEGFWCSHGILRMSTGHIKGNFGVELWIDLEMPYGYSGNSQPLYFAREHFQVVHKDPRRLLVRCETDYLSFWLLAGHAPHNGHNFDARHQWWMELQELLQEYLDQDALFLLMDANAEPGARDDVTVFSEGFRTSHNTADFRKLLLDWDLCLPGTSEVHSGTHVTWTSFDGHTEHCIDHIAVPQSWRDRCSWSTVLQDFDVATLVADHRAVALQLSWSEWRRCTSATPHSLPARSYPKGINLQSQIDAIEIQPWHTDVEKQNLNLVHHLRKALGPASRKRHKIHKPFIDEHIWDLREEKLTVKKKLRCVHKFRALQALRICFALWSSHSPASMHQVEAACAYDTTMLCHQIKLYFKFKVTTRAMKRCMTQAKQRALHLLLQQVQGTSATALLKQLKPFIGPTNPKKSKAKTLPMIRTADGQVCSHSADAVATWVIASSRTWNVGKE